MIFRILCSKHPQTVSLFEEALFPIFQGILQQDIQGNKKDESKFTFIQQF